MTNIGRDHWTTIEIPHSQSTAELVTALELRIMELEIRLIEVEQQTANLAQQIQSQHDV